MNGRSAATSLLLASALVMGLRSAVQAQAGGVPGSAAHGQATDAPSRPVEGEDFRVFDAAGRPSSFAEVLDALGGADVVLVGEEHDDVVGHRFQAELLVAAYRRLQGEGARDIVLSLEMFERDVQYILDEYLEGVISEAHFLSSSRPWDGYEHWYRPLVEFAKGHGLPIVAANAPRRYVNRVSREGPESLGALSELARSFLPPLPYPGPSVEYRAQWDVLMAEAMGGPADEDEDDDAADADVVETGDDPPPQHSMMSPNVIYSQALWDAAMGHAVTSALGRHPGSLVLHMAGSFHVERGTGIPERVAGYRPGTRVVAVVMVSAEDISAWQDEEHEGLGDFVVLTKTSEDVGDRAGN
jgi:uncharacterized iron-regulated protein